ncbi:ABC transporter permease [Cupriavidus sp. H18C2]
MVTRRRLGIGLLLCLLAFAVAAPWLAARAPFEQDLYAILQGPAWGEPLGTDHLGRSMLARLASATRLSLGLALASALSAATPGTLLGLAAAWRGGWLLRIANGLADTVLALPGLLLVLLLSAFAPGAYWPLYVGLSLVLWVEYFRLTSATARVVLASPHVEAARLLGFGPAYILRHHVLPALLPLLATLMCFGASAAVLALAAMGFVGLGAQPPQAELGLMMTELLPYAAEAPWIIAGPIVVLTLATLALVLLSGRDDAQGDVP